MRSKDLQSAMSIISPMMGLPGQEGEYDSAVLAQNAELILGEEITSNDIIAGSTDLLSKVKQISPQLISGVIGGSLEYTISTMADLPEDIQQSVISAITPIYENEMTKIGSLS